MGEADLMRLGVIALRGETIGEPHFRFDAGEKLDRHRLAPCWRDGVEHRRCCGKRPLPVGLSAHAGGGLVAGDHGALAHGLGDLCGARGERLVRTREHVGDGAFGQLQAEQAVEHLGHAIVADHLAGMQIGHQRHDAGTERAAGRHVGGRLGRNRPLAARAGAAMQLDARGHRFDGRQIDVIVGVHVRLIGRRQPLTAGAELGID